MNDIITVLDVVVLSGIGLGLAAIVGVGLWLLSVYAEGWRH